jgi:hypothetical protein
MKKKKQDKWSKLIDTFSSSNQSINATNSPANWNTIAFPMVKQVGVPSKESIKEWESKVLDNKIDNLLYDTPIEDIPRPTGGGTIANELVSVQPLSMPTGNIFFVDYQYGTQSNSDTLERI